MVTVSPARINLKQQANKGPNFPYDPVSNPEGYGKPASNQNIGVGIASGPMVSTNPANNQYKYVGDPEKAPYKDVKPNLNANKQAIPVSPVPPQNAIGQPAPITPATPATPSYINPYTDPAKLKEASESYWKNLQPGIAEGLNRVTSTVNPFMKGQIGSGLLRDVYQPAQQNLADYLENQQELGKQYDIDKEKEAKADTKEARADKISGLQSEAGRLEAAMANFQDKNSPQYLALKRRYNAIIKEVNTLLGVDAGAGVEGDQGEEVDYVAPPTQADSQEIDEMIFEYSDVQPDINSWIAQSHIHQESPGAKAFKEYERIASKIQQIKDGSKVQLTTAEIQTFTELSKAYAAVKQMGQPLGPAWLNGDVFKRWGGSGTLSYGRSGETPIKEGGSVAKQKIYIPKDQVGPSGTNPVWHPYINNPDKYEIIYT